MQYKVKHILIVLLIFARLSIFAKVFIAPQNILLFTYIIIVRKKIRKVNMYRHFVMERVLNLE